MVLANPMNVGKAVSDVCAPFGKLGSLALVLNVFLF